MKTKNILNIIFILFCSIWAHSVPITFKNAVNQVKNSYLGEHYSYSYAKVPSVINRRYGCNIDESSLFNKPWLTQSDSLWLVFVDERPMHGWSHPCKYVYLPTEATDTINIPNFIVSGNRPPHGIVNLQPYGRNGEGAQTINNLIDIESFFPANEITSYDDWLYGGTPEGRKTEVAIINCYSDLRCNYITYYFDMRYFREVLHEKFGVPNLNFTVFASGQYAEDNTPNIRELSFEDLRFMTESCSGEPSRHDVIEYLRAMQEYGPEHLVLFFSGHGDFDQNNGHYCVELTDGDFYDYELKELLDSIPSKYQTIIMENCHSGGFIETLAAKGRTIITSCRGDEEASAMLLSDEASHSQGNINFDAYPNFCNIFSHLFISALNGLRLDYRINNSGYIIPGTNTNRVVHSDLDSNGRVSLLEAFTVANDSIEQFISEANASISNPSDRIVQHAQFCSTPYSLGEDLAFNHIPDTVQLFVRDNELDTGKEANTSTSIHWNSPDIWTSTQSNLTERGLNNLELYIEPIYRANTNLYTYVKVSNRGICDYPGHGKYLHIMWTESCLNPTPAMWVGMDDNIAGGHITPVEICQPIPVGESRIITVPWTLPSVIYDKGRTNGTSFSFNLLTHISSNSNICIEEISDSLNTNRTPILSFNTLAQKSFDFQNAGGVIFGRTSQTIVANEEEQGCVVALNIIDEATNPKSIFSETNINTEINGEILTKIDTTEISLTPKQRQLVKFNISPKSNSTQDFSTLKCHAVLKDTSGTIVGGQTIRYTPNTSNQVLQTENLGPKINSIQRESGNVYRISLSESVNAGSYIQITSSLHPQRYAPFYFTDACDFIHIDIKDLPLGPAVITLVIDNQIVDSKQFIP